MIKKENLFLLLIAFFILLSFFLGFIFNENSAGGGGLGGDFGEHIWPNLNLFRNNDIISSIRDTNYSDSRTPISYILHILFNPFIDTQENFRKSVFFISLLCPIFLFLNLRLKYKNEGNTYLLIVISSLLLLSPYFRTSAFWALNENYGLLALLISYYFYQKIIFQKKIIILLLLISFTSSLCFYFDQKLLFVPLILFFLVILDSKINIQLKILFLLFYFIFSIPAFYMIYEWKSILPITPSNARQPGNQLNFLSMGYASSIIFFYFIPFFFFQKEKLINFFILNKNFFLYFYIFLLYLIVIIYIDEFHYLEPVGKGVFYKIISKFFLNPNIQFFFTILIFFISWMSINIFLKKKLLNSLIYFYLLIISLFIYPIFQEYFDPLIYILIFTFFDLNINLNTKKIYFLTTYFTIFLIGCNIYYYIILHN